MKHEMPNLQSLTILRKVEKCIDEDGNEEALHGDWYANFHTLYVDSIPGNREYAEEVLLRCVAKKRHVFQMKS
jgi:hypothetical protein